MAGRRALLRQQAAGVLRSIWPHEPTVKLASLGIDTFRRLVSWSFPAEHFKLCHSEIE